MPPDPDSVPPKPWAVSRNAPPTLEVAPSPKPRPHTSPTPLRSIPRPWAVPSPPARPPPSPTAAPRYPHQAPRPPLQVSTHRAAPRPQPLTSPQPLPPLREPRQPSPHAGSLRAGTSGPEAHPSALAPSPREARPLTVATSRGSRLWAAARRGRPPKGRGVPFLGGWTLPPGGEPVCT